MITPPVPGLPNILSVITPPVPGLPEILSVITPPVQRQHLSAVSAISHDFLFSAQFRIILHSPHNSAYFCPNRTFSHIFLKIALDCIKTKHSLSESGTFSSLPIGIWDVFVLADWNLGRFRTLLIGIWDVFVPCRSESGMFSSLHLTS